VVDISASNSGGMGSLRVLGAWLSDRPCINFRADRDCAVLGLLCNSVEHPTIGMSVCERGT